MEATGAGKESGGGLGEKRLVVAGGKTGETGEPSTSAKIEESAPYIVSEALPVEDCKGGVH